MVYHSIFNLVPCPTVGPCYLSMDKSDPNLWVGMEISTAFLKNNLILCILHTSSSSSEI